MSTQQNRASSPLGPGPGRFTLTPNKFSEAALPDISKAPTIGPNRDPAVPSESSSKVIRAATIDQGLQKRTGPRKTVPAAPRPEPATRYQPTTHPPKPRAKQPDEPPRAYHAAPRPDAATRFKLTPRPSNLPPVHSALPASAGLLKQATTQAASQAKAPRPLNSLSTSEFCDLAAHNTAAQIAIEYGVQLKTVHSQLSKVVRKKAEEEGRTIDDVKAELNQRKVASGVIPAINGRYGVRTLPPRARAGGGYVKTSDPRPSWVDESEEDEETDDEDEVGNPSTQIGVALAAGSSADASWKVISDGGQEDEDGNSVIESDQLDTATSKNIADNESAAQGEEQTSLPEDSGDFPVDRIEAREEETPASKVPEDGSWYHQVEMPDEVLFNNKASRLWMLGYRAEAMVKAEETVQYMQDFVLKPEDLD